MYYVIYIITHNIFIIIIISSLHFKRRYLHFTLDYNFRVPTRNIMYLLNKYNNNFKIFSVFLMLYRHILQWYAMPVRRQAKIYGQRYLPV